MAQAAVRRHDHPVLEENGIVRSTVFPNAVRDVRMSKGFDTLRSLHETGKVALTYTRLGKVERGEIFPAAEEMRSISRALGVQVGTLLVDVADPEFDREAWAREHIEAKLENRGGGIEAMHLGAAMRVCRLAMERSTTDMKTPFGLPAATVSRIENAERPMERWDADTQNGIAKVLSVGRASGIRAKVRDMFESGQLDDMLRDLFSPEAIERRNAKRLKALLTDLSVAKATRMVEAMVANDNSVPVMAGSGDADGVFHVSASKRMVLLPEGVSRNSVAVEMMEPVLGPGLPRGTVVLFDLDQPATDGDVGAVMSASGDTVRILSVSQTDGGLVGYSMTSAQEVDLSALQDGERLVKMVSAIA